ncbi:exopolysaccharide biosynthesis polyprenyl glycosylphosphotransferase [Aquimarina sp. ERC-38]|uniref:exopolysaccharide biosynthesis polyprenyl glycosylphosphotransferase n=1 Tax=Aquimarina sp. ERC-38 TaxID=2949996 RepID=UPI0022471FCF|nr:exopolysaccharide biosynthesis polyprenyl glycosylphosphotransferase [Aquimarina sp. ERC-38]UZO81865.1 exopolysaccharide biosynthesis polyprenyl glycosylphosphotransferase [Aquimarina sp. ERC-38]
MNKIFTLNIVERKIFLYIGDLIIVVFFLFLMTRYTLKGTFNVDRYEVPVIVLGIALFTIIAYIIDIYNLERAAKAVHIFRSSLIVGLLYSFGIFFLTIIIINTTISRPYLIAFLTLMPFSLTAWRLISSNFFISTPFLKKVIYIYENQFESEVKKNIKNIQGHKNSNGFKVKFKISTCHKTFTKNSDRLIKILPKVDTIILRIQNYQEVSKELESFLTRAMFIGKEVFTYTSFYETSHEALPIHLVGNNFYEVLQLKNSKTHYIYVLFKKLIDIILCTTIGIPFMIITPIIIFINLFFNKGPLFYKQKRLGKKGKEFYVYKFRSMVTNAEKDGARMSTMNDSRVTPFGSIMRKLRIDEIPQIISVLQGNMSFIGPRPERKFFVDQLDEMNPFYSVRHVIKPGITGWAQVKYKYGENLDDSLKKLEYDLYYIKNRSVTLDLRILFKTITTVIFSRGV